MVADYNYTKPRRPIAAMFNSPGPAVYNIPPLVGRVRHDPRSVHTRYPAFSFGIRLYDRIYDISPGPIYLPPAKMLRDGMLGSPKYTMLSRHPTKGYDGSPGPAVYLPGNWAAPRPPAYTFGTKHRELTTFMTPAPNLYTLPPMVGETVESTRSSAPMYSIIARNYMPDSRMKVPGPGTYKIVDTNVFLPACPHYSMSARNEPPGDRTQKPGPGAHYPEFVKSNRPQPPRFSFGIKHSQYSGTMGSPPNEDGNQSCDS